MLIFNILEGAVELAINNIIYSKVLIRNLELGVLFNILEGAIEFRHVVADW